MLAAFQKFISKMKADFARIARATRNTLSADELKTEAWILGYELGEKRQRDIDFGDDADQQLILGTLYIQHVKRGTKSVRYAISIDQSHESDEGEINPWANRLTAPEMADPLKSLIQHESAIDEKAVLTDSYSQAAAYVKVFTHFKNYRNQVCAYLCISGSTLRYRVHNAAQSVRVQPSLFDGIERITDNFMPLRGHNRLPCITVDKRNDPHRNHVLFV